MNKKVKKSKEKAAENTVGLLSGKDTEQKSKVLRDFRGLFIPGTTGKEKLYPKPEELDQAIDDYFDICEEKKKPVTMSGLAYFLGFKDRRSLINYEKAPGYEAYYEIIHRAKLRLEAAYEEYLVTKNIPAGVIFNLKNNFDWKDEKHLDLTSKNAFLTQLVAEPATQISHENNKEDNKD